MTGQLIGLTPVGVTTHKTSNDDKWCTQGRYTNGYSVCARQFSVLGNGGISECYNGTCFWTSTSFAKCKE